MKTQEEFTTATGQLPVSDDLERVNCSKAGELHHMGCGWCETHDLPQFMCECDPYKKER